MNVFIKNRMCIQVSTENVKVILRLSVVCVREARAAGLTTSSPGVALQLLEPASCCSVDSRGLEDSFSLFI